MKQDKKVPLPPGVGLRRPLHQPLQAPHRGFLLRGLRPPAHDGARLRDARVHHAVRPSGAADRGGCRLQPAVLFGRLLHGEPRRALPQDRHGQGEVVEEVEGRGRKGRGREEEEERHTTLQKTKKTRDFLERDLSSLHSLSLFSTAKAQRKRFPTSLARALAEARGGLSAGIDEEAKRLQEKRTSPRARACSPPLFPQTTASLSEKKKKVSIRSSDPLPE